MSLKENEYRALRMLNDGLSMDMICDVCKLKKSQIVSLYTKYGLLDRDVKQIEWKDVDELIKLREESGYSSALLSNVSGLSMKEVKEAVFDDYDFSYITLTDSSILKGYLSGYTTVSYTGGEISVKSVSGSYDTANSERTRNWFIKNTLGPNGVYDLSYVHKNKTEAALFMEGLFQADGFTRVYNHRAIHTFTSSRNRTWMMKHFYKLKEIPYPYGREGMWRIKWSIND